MISKRSIQNFFIILTVLATILLSKSYYFGVANRGTYQYVYYVLVLFTGLFVGISARKLKHAVIILLPTVGLLVANMLLNSGEMTASGVNQVLGIALTFICAGIAGSYITIEKFSEYYIKCMYFICLVSIPCFLIAVFNPELARTFCQPGYNWQVPVGYSFFYTWGWNGVIFQRNSGIFWEPGAFQGFIILALLMLLYENDDCAVKNRKLKLLVFAVTILTTQSSTGYILLVLLFLTQWQRIENIFGDINNVVRNFIVAVVVIGAIAIIISSGNISSKLANASTDSATIRFSDLVGGGLMVLKGGLFGLGETTTRSVYRTLFGVSSNDSVGLLAMTYTYGILFAVCYLYLMICGIKKFFHLENSIDVAIIVAVFVILHLTEGLWWLSVYVSIPIIGILGGGVLLAEALSNLSFEKCIEWSPFGLGREVTV